MLYRETILVHRPVLLASPHFPLPSHIPYPFLSSVWVLGDWPMWAPFLSSLSASLGLGIGWTAGGEKWGCPLLCSPHWPHQCSGHDYPSKNVATGVWSPTLLLPPHQARGTWLFSSCCLHLGVSESLGAPSGCPTALCKVSALCEVVALGWTGVSHGGSDT